MFIEDIQSKKISNAYFLKKFLVTRLFSINISTPQILLLLATYSLPFPKTLFLINLLNNLFGRKGNSEFIIFFWRNFCSNIISSELISAKSTLSTTIEQCIRWINFDEQESKLLKRYFWFHTCLTIIRQLSTMNC